MAKVLISSIGTGDIIKDSDSDYQETIYIIEGKEYKNTLTSQPIIQHFNINKVFFIGTKGSMWDNLYFKYGGEDEKYLDLLTNKKYNKTLTESDLKVLEETIDNFIGSNGSKCILLDYETNDENEIWKNFEKIIELKKFLSEKDEIYLDITHGFRYMSVLNIFAMEFLSQLNENLKPKAVLYGMFSQNKSQILNFNIFFELLEWAKAIEEMENFASLNRLIRLANSELDKQSYNILLRANEAFSIANMSAIKKSINRLKTNLKNLQKQESKIFKMIFPRIEKFIYELSTNTLSEFQFKLAKFFSSKNNYALAYIALAEAVISYICEKEGFQVDSKEGREKAKDLIFEKDFPYEHPRRKFARIYNQISTIRNNIAHQLETTKNPKDDIENFDKYYQESRKYLKELFF